MGWVGRERLGRPFTQPLKTAAGDTNGDRTALEGTGGTGSRDAEACEQSSQVLLQC